MSSPTMPERSYGCTYGCGNPYDFVIITVADSTTEFLCMPCFVRLASDVVSAMTDPDNEVLQTALANVEPVQQTPMRDSKPRKRGHNAPATTEDEDLLDAYEDVITVDELPGEFK